MTTLSKWRLLHHRRRLMALQSSAMLTNRQSPLRTAQIRLQTQTQTQTTRLRRKRGRQVISVHRDRNYWNPWTKMKPAPPWSHFFQRPVSPRMKKRRSYHPWNKMMNLRKPLGERPAARTLLKKRHRSMMRVWNSMAPRVGSQESSGNRPRSCSPQLTHKVRWPWKISGYLKRWDKDPSDSSAS